MKAKARKVSQAEAKRIAEQLVKEWHASAKKKTTKALSRKTTATGRGRVKFHGIRVLERYGAPVAPRAMTKRGSASD
jgi:hypothetical protein